MDSLNVLSTERNVKKYVVNSGSFPLLYEVRLSKSLTLKFCGNSFGNCQDKQPGN